MSAVPNVIAAQAAMTPPSSKPILTAVTLAAWVDGEDAAETSKQVAKVEHSRLVYLRSMFQNTDVASVKAAVKGAKADKEREFGKDSPKFRSFGKRASEIQSLYGAWRFCGFDFTGMGYHPAYAQAVQTLKAKGLVWTGEHKATPAEVAERREEKAKMAVNLNALEILRKEKLADTPENIATALALAKDNRVHTEMFQIGLKLCEQIGIDKVKLLVQILPEAIAAYAANVAAEEGTVKAE